MLRLCSSAILYRRSYGTHFASMELQTKVNPLLKSDQQRVVQIDFRPVNIKNKKALKK